MELSICNVCKSYKKNIALFEFSFRFTPGIYALLGPNGSGKSTLMNIITDNLKADKGTIAYDGKDVVKMGSEYLSLLGYMPQYTGMYSQFSAEEYLYYIASLKGLKEPKNQINKVLQDMELDDVATKKTYTYSGGMKQRLALAQAMLGDPKIIVLDEPTAGLDPKQRIAVRNYISKNSIERIVIVATHVVSDIEYIAKEAIFLKKGKIIDHGTPSDLAKKSEGKVWSVHCTARDVSAFQNDFRVINIFSDGDDVSLRIFSEIKPCTDAVQASPTLEDEYIRVFSS